MAMMWVAAHDADNAGDIVLLACMEKILHGIDSEIVKVYDWKEQKLASAYNAADCIVVGGGGLMIRDTKPNNTSGWRWNISEDVLREIKKPLIVMSVGLNRFRGQEDFYPMFRSHIGQVVSKSVFFGMREGSGIPRMRQYVGDLVDQISWSPCPAAICGMLYPQIAETSRKEKMLVFAPAMDRLHYRGRINNLVNVLREYANEFDLHIACHIKADLDIAKYVKDIPHKLDNLCSKPATYIMEYYASASAVVGMRLHSLLIPFGLGTPIIPIISHDKIADWLKDIHSMEWGCELDEPFIYAHIERGLERGNVDLEARSMLHDTIMDNINYINMRLSL